MLPLNSSLIFWIARTASVGIQSLSFLTFFPPFSDFEVEFISLKPVLLLPAACRICRSLASAYSQVFFNKESSFSLSYLREKISIWRSPLPFLETYKSYIAASKSATCFLSLLFSPLFISISSSISASLSFIIFASVDKWTISLSLFSRTRLILLISSSAVSISACFSCKVALVFSWISFCFTATPSSYLPMSSICFAWAWLMFACLAICSWHF